MSQNSKTIDSPQFQLTVEYFFTVVSSWLVPGSGHWLLGYRFRGGLLGASILLLFWVGQVLAIPPEPPPEERSHARKPLAVSLEVHPYFFICQVGNGFSTLFSNVLWGEPRTPEKALPNEDSGPDRSLPRNLNLAILLTTVSGLLNYLLVLHVMDPRTWEEAARHRAAAGLEPRSGEDSA
jgi:hypothetical protein